MESGIRIKLKSYDVSLLEASVNKIVEVIREIGIPCRGAIALPNKKFKITIKKSTHIYKEANETYQQNTHQRLICIRSNSPEVIDKLAKITLVNSVHINIKTT